MALDRTETFYAADDAIPTFGGQFLVGDGGSPEAFEAIATIVSIQPGTSNSEDSDTTHLRSPDRHREHSAGISDDDVWTIEVIYMPGENSHATDGGGTSAFASGGIPSMRVDGLKRNFKLRWDNGTGSPMTGQSEVQIRGYVASFGLGPVEVTGVQHATIDIMPSQAPIFP
jgi:hypothetical protein